MGTTISTQPFHLSPTPGFQEEAGDKVLDALFVARTLANGNNVGDERLDFCLSPGWCMTLPPLPPRTAFSPPHARPSHSFPRFIVCVCVCTPAAYAKLRGAAEKQLSSLSAGVLDGTTNTAVQGLFDALRAAAKASPLLTSITERRLVVAAHLHHCMLVHHHHHHHRCTTHPPGFHAVKPPTHAAHRQPPPRPSHRTRLMLVTCRNCVPSAHRRPLAPRTSH